MLVSKEKSLISPIIILMEATIMASQHFIIPENRGE